MINRNEFQKAAKKFRGGRLSLSEFTATVFSSTGNSGEPEPAATTLKMPTRPSQSHKGDYGRLLLVGGSGEMPGAIALSAMAALRTGSGLATVATVAEAQSVVASFSPCLMTLGMPSSGGFWDSAALERLLKLCSRADVVAMGPGMGRTAGGQAIVSDMYRNVPRPMVVDADAINNVVDAGIDLADHAGPRIFTPHLGEFSRLLGDKVDLMGAEEIAPDFARRTGTIIVVKGHRSIITDGQIVHRNGTGNAGMATAGAGDVLTGIIASLVGQGMGPLDAAQFGCHLHGLAGDCYTKHKPATSLIATDLIDYLPSALADA